MDIISSSPPETAAGHKRRRRALGARRFLAVDLGAESGRAVLGVLESGRLQTTEIHRFSNVPIRLFGHWHWDVYRLFDEVKTGLARAAAEAPGGVDSIGVDTWGVDFGLLARDGSLLGLPFCYRDPRTQGALEEFLKIVPRERVYELTGIQFLPFNTATRSTRWSATIRRSSMRPPTCSLCRTSSITSSAA
jgi:rhamnulokinase